MASSQKIPNEIPGEAPEPLPLYVSSPSQSLAGPAIEPPPAYGNGPPTYDNATLGTAGTELVPPDTLLLNGKVIHSGGSVSSPCLYELSHHIAQRELTTTVELSRLDHRAHGTTSQAVPDAAGRVKSIFTLTHLPPITTPKFEYYLHSTSRGNVGNVGLEPYSGFRSGSGYRVLRVTRPRVAAQMEAKELLFVAKARGTGRYDWRDGGDGRRVLAYEADEGAHCRFQIVEDMDQGRRDALVGAWCLRVWQEIVESRPTTRYRRHRHGHLAV
ncbi:uncharacterized protein DNG_02187 [Cephalotrichum gorgonifer]|uniref:Uncharacterized protein n=1 Tax=Cephalotrichum gorgonifer TaxID=2041049 RepID=A0AAE8SSB6_9PEZI|nr:uncharacterized protein DNG_02187 [Cephalotrichum gorgonifer]